MLPLNSEFIVVLQLKARRSSPRHSSVAFKDMDELDRWAVIRLNQLVEKCLSERFLSKKRSLEKHLPLQAKVSTHFFRRRYNPSLECLMTELCSLLKIQVIWEVKGYE